MKGSTEGKCNYSMCKLKSFFCVCFVFLTVVDFTLGCSVHCGFTGIDFYFHMNRVPELWSMAMPNPSALFCRSNAFRSRTLESNNETPSHTQ